VSQVEAGSQDDAEVFDDLPPTAAIDAAMDRSEAQQPLLQLTRGYRQRRATLSDRPWEEGEGGSPGAAGRGGVGLVGYAGAGDWRPNWDLHSVAESMRQVRRGVRVLVRPLALLLTAWSPPCTCHLQCLCDRATHVVSWSVLMVMNACMETLVV
jgi:hypothetical protein